MSSFLDPADVSLNNLAGGAAIERFDLELKHCLENILDVNTEAKKKRSITLKVIFAPSDDRDFASVDISCVSSLAPLESFASRLYIGRDNDGKPVARQTHFKQTTFADLNTSEDHKPETDTNVTRLERRNG
jgi:hypothetical protein